MITEDSRNTVSGNLGAIHSDTEIAMANLSMNSIRIRSGEIRAVDVRHKANRRISEIRNEL